MKTVLSLRDDKFLVNGNLTYREIDKCAARYHGLLMNARMIQGVFDDKADPRRFDRFGKKFDPDRNTDDLIKALSGWYSCGLRAITVGFQGGGPCFTVDNYSIENSPYSSDGTVIDPDYAERMKRIIMAADEIGMIVICSLFYGAQSRFLADDIAVMNAVKTACNWMRDNKFSNVIVEIANEHDISCFQRHPVLYSPSGMVQLIEIAKRESGGMPVGCSGTGGYFSAQVAESSDVILIHGNDQSRQKLYNLIQKAKSIRPIRPVVINEDSQALSNMQVAMNEGVSWGYYNNLTKQEPPTDWGITQGEDSFFAMRIALNLGIEDGLPALEDQLYLQGLEEHMVYDSKRWIRLASLYPEKIDKVDFFRNNIYVGSAYDDPFILNSVGSNWLLLPFPDKIGKGERWRAAVYMTDGSMITKESVF